MKQTELRQPMKTIKCPACKGRGEITVAWNSSELMTCRRCGGTGRLPARGNEQKTKKAKSK